MSNRFRFSWPGWINALLCAVLFLVALDAVRIRHTAYVTGVADSSGGSPDDQSGWRPRLIVPEHDDASYEWLDQTRQMFDRGEWRVRRVDYENAPVGHDVLVSSPYRWWLGLIAWCDHIVTGHPLGQGIEFAALIADPLLHLLLLVGTAGFVVKRLGGFAGACVAIGLATLYPFSLEFLAGMPDNRGLLLALSIWSILSLIAGAIDHYSTDAGRADWSRRWFAVGGFFGGLALWVDASKQAPIIAGLALGGTLASWLARRSPGASPGTVPSALPWRLWSLAGACTTLAAYLAEFFPSHLGSWQLQTIHPIYALAWIGAGEIPGVFAGSAGPRKLPALSRRMVVGVLAALAIAAAPIAMWKTRTLGFFEMDPSALRLTRLRGDANATNFCTWLLHDGISPAVRATLLPLVLLLPAVWLLVRRQTGPGLRSAIAIALGPVLIAIGFACRQIGWWNGVDAALVVLLAAVATVLSGPDSRRYLRWILATGGALLLVPGVVQFFPAAQIRANRALDGTEVYTLIERDLARWLARHADPAKAIVLAPHDQTATLYYYGGLRGVPTLDPENRAGLGAAVRILSASTPEEAKALIDERGITHIVIPSWDTYLDIYARMGMGQLEGTFMSSLHEWKLPPWLRPVPFQLPAIPGFEGLTLTVLEVVADQDDASSLSRVAEYFVEMGQLDQATAVAQGLRRFPANLGALTARAEVAIAVDDNDEFGRMIDLLRPFLAAKADRRLPWDRRAALAAVLARARETALSREQVQRCFTDIDEPKLRSLTTNSLYRLLVLGRAFGFSIADPKLHTLALELLPAEMRRRIELAPSPG